ncbi:hypothetical protein JTE90_011070 [Oedothorax gibbosus]|uniref:Uncharacterized protein n=1 Tax=Oedothorax gibbosus TaxID=931172 RepID=A0AAV6UNV5_9ARAC|nr:hypothetical protein JTE90_011070 [Oedothorax gibbosus]
MSRRHLRTTAQVPDPGLQLLLGHLLVHFLLYKLGRCHLRGFLGYHFILDACCLLILMNVLLPLPLPRSVLLPVTLSRLSPSYDNFRRLLDRSQW